MKIYNSIFKCNLAYITFFLVALFPGCGWFGFDEVVITVPDDYHGVFGFILSPDAHYPVKKDILHFDVPDSGLLKVRYFSRTDQFNLTVKSASGKIFNPSDLDKNNPPDIFYLNRSNSEIIWLFYIGSRDEFLRIEDDLAKLEDSELLNKYFPKFKK